MDPAEEENRFFDLLREKFDGREEQPLATTWPTVSRTLPPIVRPWYRSAPVGTAGLLGVVLGVLIGWWVGVAGPEKGHFQRPRATGTKTTATGTRTTATGMETTATGGRSMATGRRTMIAGRRSTATGNETTVVGRPSTATGTQTTAAGGLTGVTPAPTMVGGPAPVGVAAVAAGAAAGSQPGALGNESGSVAPVFTLWTAALAQDSAIRQEGARAVAPGRADSASRLPALVTEQRATLRLLQHRLDSLKAALPTEPPLLAGGDSTKAVRRDSVGASLLPPRRPWALSALVDPAKSWGTLPGYPTGESRQQLTDALTRGVRLERALGARWTARLGLGEARVRGQFDYDSTVLGRRSYSDTIVVTNFTVAIKVDTTFIVQQYQLLQLSPRINSAGQIIGYDSLYVTRYDTSYQVVIAHDTLRRTQQTVSTREQTWRERRQQQLRPEYRFWTIPISVQYDVLAWRRWRAGLSAGAQVMVFRSGQQPVWRGDHYELRRIGPRDGPFRPVSLALTTALEVRYRLTDRLSLVGGGTVRGWAVNPVRGVAKVQLTPGALLGVSWGFGRGMNK